MNDAHSSVVSRGFPGGEAIPLRLKALRAYFMSSLWRDR